MIGRILPTSLERSPVGRAEEDRGVVLAMTLVITVALSFVILALAEYTSTTLRYGQVSEQRADRFAAADGGMDSELEDLRRKSSLCATALGNGGGVTHTFGDDINGMRPRITCEIVGGDVSGVDAWAIVITGEGGASGDLMYISGGGQSENALKTFTGPVFISDVNRMGFQADLVINEGDLWITDPGCEQIYSAITVSLPSSLAFTPEGRGTRCTQASWSEIFGPRKPPEPSTAALNDPVQYPVRSATPPAEDGWGCTRWLPGRYAAPPDFKNGSYNYFVSGNYFFDNTGPITTKGSWVLAGYPGVDGPSIHGIKNGDTAGNNPCRFAWDDDKALQPADRGATFYLGGNSRFVIESGSSLEVSGKRQGVTKVSLQALEIGAYASTVRASQGTDGLVARTQSGNNKQLAMRGLVWAPYAGFEFDNITNKTVAALQGGAVVAQLSAGASANANNFLIEVDTQSGDTNLRISSTAEVGGGSTTVQAIVRYRPTDGEYAVLSRRVVDITPES